MDVCRLCGKCWIFVVNLRLLASARRREGGWFEKIHPYIDVEFLVVRDKSQWDNVLRFVVVSVTGRKF